MRESGSFSGCGTDHQPLTTAYVVTERDKGLGFLQPAHLFELPLPAPPPHPVPVCHEPALQSSC